MLIGAVLFVLSAAAENYPYRSDVLWVTVPDHADWLYKTGEKAKIEVQFYKYGIPQDGVEVLYELGGDMMPSDTKGTVKLKNGKAVISMGTMKEPGFRDCRLTAKLGGKTYSHHIKVGFISSIYFFHGKAVLRGGFFVSRDGKSGFLEAWCFQIRHLVPKNPTGMSGYPIFLPEHDTKGEFL